METQKFLITGGTGFIGQYLSEELMKQGHYVTIVTRSPEKYTEEQATNQEYIGWDDVKETMNRIDVVVNLVGENIFGKRWTEKVKNKIYNSRIESTRKIVDAIGLAENKPELLISASGISIYGDSGDKVLDESSSYSDDFLARVCQDWEKEAQKASEFDVRVANPRFGIVLEEDGGMVEIMKVPFNLFVGGPVGSGKQYVPWVHMRDLCRAVMFPMDHPEISGPYNVCSPEPETMGTLAKVFGRVMNRPSFFKVPEPIIKGILGEASVPIVSSVRAQPKVLQLNDFQFEFEDLEEALADIL